MGNTNQVRIVMPSIQFGNFKTRKNIISNRIERPAKKSRCRIQKECEV